MTEEVLAELLDRWRAGRQPELAAAIDAVSARIPRPPIAGKTLKARHAAWLACARLGDPADVPRLLALLREGTAAKQVEAKIEALVARGPDPRVAAALVELVTGQRLFFTLQWFWSVLLRAIKAMGDPRGMLRLRAEIPAHEPAHGFRYMGDREVFSLERYLWEWLPEVVQHLAGIEIAPLTDADRAALERTLAPSREERTEAELLDAVLADPGDDAPRLVLADALQARGDPRGELIALQIRRGRGGKVSAREKLLVRSLTSQIVGPLAPVAFHPVIERGFLAGAHAVFTRDQLALRDHPWWRTVESLSTDELHLLQRPDLTALRQVRPWRAVFAFLAGPPRPRIESLGLSAQTVREHATVLATSRALPDLRELIVEGDPPPTDDELAPILRGALGASLQTVVTSAGRYNVSR